MPPHAGLGPVNPRPLACNADVLAREAAADDVDESAPRHAVEGLHIIPDGEVWQHPIALTSEQHPLTVGVDLDGADGAPAEQRAAEDAAPGAGEQGKLP